ncbi:MAG TPA: c-type cytochrome [Candidatus Binatia bacterium]|jgi:cytochrome c2
MCILVYIALLITVAIGCDRAFENTQMKMTGGDPHSGKTAIRRYGCGACHIIPGISGANGVVGPSLDGIGTRAYVAGVLANTPSQMILWIQYPQNVAPRKAMPNLGVTEKDARDIAAYLYSLTKSTPLR